MDRFSPEERFPAENRVPTDVRIPAEFSIPEDEKLFSVRIQFVNRVSEPVLDQLLDRLLERGMINDAEMQSARTKTQADRARDVIDMVRKKGRTASLALIAALREVDPCLSRQLNLS